MTDVKPNPGKARRYRGQDASVRVSERRERFVEAGLACFGTRGFHDVTVKELCSEARLTERYFYESFQDREALFAVLYEALIAKLRDDLLAAVGKAADPAAMARAGLGVFFRALKRDPRIARILLLEVLTVSKDMDRAAQRATLGFGDLLQRIVLSTWPRKSKGGLDLDFVASGLIGATLHIAMRWTLAGFKAPTSTVIDSALAFYLALIRLAGDDTL